eukprot:3740391-Rhodomonas_salina.1
MSTPPTASFWPGKTLKRPTAEFHSSPGASPLPGPCQPDPRTPYVEESSWEPKIESDSPCPPSMPTPPTASFWPGTRRKRPTA